MSGKIHFSPRAIGEGNRIIKTESLANEFPFHQGLQPEIAIDSTEPEADLNMNNVKALVHGISVDYAVMALNNGFLSSSYRIKGPDGDYVRTGDYLGGGALGVYTRAVSALHTNWPASGRGVGSSKSKVQLIFSPELLCSDITWRHSNSDINGKAPGVTDEYIKNIHQYDCYDMWKLQTKSVRNKEFNSLINDRKMDGNWNNEQMFWEKIPLEDYLVAIICNTTDQRNRILQGVSGVNNRITIGERTVPIVVCRESAKLVRVLNKMKQDALIEGC